MNENNPMNIKNKYNWYDITLYQFNKLQELIKIEDETERLVAITELVLGSEVVNLPINEFKKEAQKLDFLKEPIPDKIPPKKVELNGRKYYIDSLLGNITTAQYVDFVNHSKGGDMAKMLSVFIIPEGHKYNDGYDMLQVIADIELLPIPVVNSTAFFFKRQLLKFIQIFQSYSVKQIRKLKLPKGEKEQMEKIVKDLTHLASYHIS